MFKLFISPDSTVLTGKPCTTQIINFRGVVIYFLGEGVVVDQTPTILVCKPPQLPNSLEGPGIPLKTS